MSGLVCLYVIGITALVAAGAAAVEWGAQGRIPARYIWSIAMLAALVVPAAALVQHARVTARSAASPAETVFVNMVHVGRAVSAVAGAHEAGSPLNTLRDEYRSAVTRVSHVGARGIVAGWVVASLALIGWIGFGVAYWHRARGEWEETELDGVSVHLSARTGPAVLGVLSQRIVLPAWARTLAPEYRRLMLAHECEHIAARDPQRLACALAALVAMPWNPVLWWCAARLRRAIEMDCDARVLRRHPVPCAYGHLLLQVAARGNNVGPLAVPLVNLLRLPSELELRLRAMARPRTIGRRTALIGAACAAAAVSAAFTAPVPRVTRTTIRNLAQPARTRLARGEATVERTVVRVGSTVLGRDSAQVDARRGVVQGRVRELHGAGSPHAHAADTIPSAVAEDSLATLARQLREQARQLDSVRARADSLDAEVRAVRAARGIRMLGGMAPVAPGVRRFSAEFMTTGGKPGGLVDAARMQREFARSGTHIGAALAQNYPDLAADASTSTMIWFVADSSGAVLRTSRSDDRPFNISPQIAARRFPDVDPRDIDFVSIRKWALGDRDIAVAWVGLKR